MKYPVLKAKGTWNILERATPLPINEVRRFSGRDFECIHLDNGLVAVVNENERLRTVRADAFVSTLVAGGMVRFTRDVMIGKFVGDQFVGLDDKTIADLRLELAAMTLTAALKPTRPQKVRRR
jgi:hypothetical protein